MTLVIKSNNKSLHDIKCYFCNGTHSCKNCPTEATIAPILKKKVGSMIEHYIANNLKCPECDNLSLHVIGNNTPSLDIICQCCEKKFEVKSKCLSVNKIPTDITLSHGSYIDYTHRLKEQLNLIVLIYGVDRFKKEIYIREVIYANSDLLKNKSIIEVVQKYNSNLSIIFIKNKNFLIKLNLQTTNLKLTFQNDVNDFIN